MIDNFFLYNYPIKSTVYNKDLISYNNSSQHFFKLKTCQRLLILSHGPLNTEVHTKNFKKSSGYLALSGANAYQYLLEVLCGLQSQMLGENEIVNQFKVALKDYGESVNRHRSISIILEKLLKDAKEIRTEFLSHIGQSSYAAVARKILGKSSNAKEILIIGTGHLALDLLQYFKKTHSITMCARNKAKLEEWQQIATFKTLPWLDLKKIVKYPLILNTVGVPNYKLLDKHFFSEWHKLHKNQHACFIDFGTPSSIEFPENSDRVYSLDDLFTHGSEFDLQKIAKIEQAKRAIEQIALKRILWLDQKVQRDLAHLVLQNPVTTGNNSFNY